MLDPPIRVVYAQTMGGPNIIRKTFRVLVSLIAVTAFSSTPAETIRSIRTQIGEAWHIQDMANSASGYVTLKSYKLFSKPIKIRSDLTRVIRDTFDNISRAAELDARLLLIRGSEPNAFAGPINGVKTVGVNFAMVTLVGYNSDQWAALLGHELAHLKLEHVTKNLMRRIPIAILQEIVRSNTADPTTQLGVDLLAQLVNTHFSRDQERESDYLGAIWAIEAGYSAFGAAELHQRMYEKRGGSLVLPFLTSHPTGPERIETLKALAVRLTPSDVLPYIEHQPSASDLSRAELVKLGMYPETATALLGDPYHVETFAGGEFWYYCEGGVYADKMLSLHFVAGQLVDKRIHSDAGSDYSQKINCAQ